MKVFSFLKFSTLKKNSNYLISSHSYNYIAFISYFSIYSNYNVKSKFFSNLCSNEVLLIFNMVCISGGEFCSVPYYLLLLVFRFQKYDLCKIALKNLKTDFEPFFLFEKTKMIIIEWFS